MLQRRIPRRLTLVALVQYFLGEPVVGVVMEGRIEDGGGIPVHCAVEGTISVLGNGVQLTVIPLPGNSGVHISRGSCTVGSTCALATGSNVVDIPRMRVAVATDARFFRLKFMEIRPVESLDKYRLSED